MTHNIACPKCAGKGHIPHFNHVEGGVCFRCKGTGIDPKARAIKPEPEHVQAVAAVETQAQVDAHSDPAESTPADLAITVKPLAFATKKDRLAFWRFKLGTVDAWAIRALTRIYAEQTEDEQAGEATIEDNGYGFSGFHAEILSSFAAKVESFDPSTSKYSTPLSAKQMAILKAKMPSYAKQLIELLGDDIAGTILPSKAAREAWLDIHGEAAA